MHSPIIKKILCFFTAAAVIAAAPLVYAASDYPDLNTAPILPPSSLEIAAQLPEPPGNIAVSKEGRIFFTIHPESKPDGFKLYELKNGVPAAYPDEDFQKRFNTPLGLAIDGKNQLWVIDHGSNGRMFPRLFAFDLDANKPAHDHTFGRGIGQIGSYFNDLRVSRDGKTVYIADISFLRKNPAIVVYDVDSQKARRVLQDHASVKPQDWIVKTQTREMVFLGGLIKMKLGVDGIALDAEDEWLYYGAMNQDSVFRIRTADLKNTSLTKKELEKLVERYGGKPLSDGLEMDSSGNLYITDVEHGTIFRLDPQRRLKTLIAAPQFRWPDGMSAAGGFLYVTDSALSEALFQSKKHLQASAPFFIYRIKLEANNS